MGTSVGDVFVSVGLDIDDKQLKSFEGTLQTTFNSMLKLAGITASVAGFKNFMEGATDAAVRLRNLSAELNVNSYAVQKWANTVHQANPLISIEAAQEGYAKLQKALTDISQGKGPSGALSRLAGGNVAGMSPDEVLERISANKQKFMRENGPGATALHSALMDQVFGGSGWERAMDMTREQRDTIGKQMVVEQQNLDKLDKLADEMAKLGELWHKLIMDTAATLAPAIGGAAAAMNKGGVKGLLEHIGKNSYLPGAIEWIGKHSWIDWVGEHSPFSGAVAGAAGRVGNSISLSERKKQAQAYFQSQGWADFQAGGMVRRLIAESNLNPGTVGDGGSAVGIAQWHPDRQRKFKELTGKDIKDSSFQEQLAFVQHELTQGDERYSGAKMRSTKNEAEAYGTFTNNYERPASKVEVNQSNTINLNSNSNPTEIANEFVRINQGNLNAAYSERNLGSNY